MENSKLAKNVLEFIDKASGAVGRWENENFNQRVWGECRDLGMESPIEHILYVAIQALARINYIEEADNPVEENGEWHVEGLGINPQKKIDRYRVDFSICHERRLYNPTRWESKEILVECDSQQFHERTEHERRYEKQRDRYLTAHGYTVLHFTGSEIVQNPWKVAAEILAAVCTDRPNIDELLGTAENYCD